MLFPLINKFFIIEKDLKIEIFFKQPIKNYSSMIKGCKISFKATIFQLLCLNDDFWQKGIKENEFSCN